MAVFTNPLGLLYAEVDSAGSLKLAGDRVIFGAHRANQAESEWLERQRVSQCLETIAVVVHAHGGVVALKAGDRVFCNLPNAQAAAEAACAIQTQLAERNRGLTAPDGTPLGSPLELKIALHHGPILVNAGHLGGEALDLLRAVLKQTGSDEILATAPFVSALDSVPPEALHDLGEVELDGAVKSTHLVEVLASKMPGAGSIPSSVPASVEPASATERPAQPESSASSPEKSERGGTSRTLADQPDLARVAAGKEQPRPRAAQPVGNARDPAPASGQPGLPTAPSGRPPASPPGPSGPEVVLNYGGKTIVLNRDHPTLMLRSGKDRREHAKIRLDGERFVLENLNVSGTHIRRGDGSEELCLMETELAEEGAISLGADFGHTTNIIQYSASR